MLPELDDLVEACTESPVDDWAFWEYVCEDPPAAGDRYARAVCCARPRVGLAWSPAAEDESAFLTEWGTPVLEQDRLYHWVELLYDGLTVHRSLAAWSDETRVSLPAPHAEPRGAGGRVLWVAHRDWRLTRLANRVVPGSGDFDACFLRSGMEVR